MVDQLINIYSKKVLDLYVTSKNAGVLRANLTVCISRIDLPSSPFVLTAPVLSGSVYLAFGSEPVAVYSWPSDAANSALPAKRWFNRQNRP